jgi:inorganic pyrophosphatase
MSEVEIVVETPSGSGYKYEVDPSSWRVRLHRCLSRSLRFPVNYGFIPGTLGLDGDPLDALLLAEEPLAVGCLAIGRPIGVLRLRDEHGGDNKVLFTPVADPGFDGVVDLRDLPVVRRREIEQFFSEYKQLEGGQPQLSGWGRAAAARQEIAAAFARQARATASSHHDA